ncbi:Asp/Glu racemase [Thalassospiraceae bacterium LMO-JJ14]|nr:Asp/Glu racemase [Thalassospiraceae bacterium LMO-JJ14]
MTISSKPFDIVFDAGRHPLAKLGFILLATEQTVQDDMIAICPPGVGVHFARVDNPDSITNESLSAIAPDLTRAARTILPDGSLDVVSYACTSGSLVLGQERVEALLRDGNPNAKASSIIAAVIRALQAVGARKIVVATPYLDEINTAEKAYLQDRGFDVLDIQGLNLEKDSDMVRVSPDFIMDMALQLDRPDADAIFISCGALRSVDVIEALEEKTGKPVITSNQALAWDALRLAGMNEKRDGYGRLLREL